MAINAKDRSGEDAGISPDDIVDAALTRLRKF
jgi:hypothetical protein